MNANYDSTDETLKHKLMVARYLRKFATELLFRAENHDASKLEAPEKAIFDEYTPKLKNTTYGSDEYKQYLAEMQVALHHHYMTNRHHPEHFQNDISGMNLIDVIEMFCDWIAATQRHADGNIIDSININERRFMFSDELKSILLNTITDLM